jgi:endonuclease YncB( thermonuclease family)
LKALSFLVLLAAALLELALENTVFQATISRPEGPQLVGLPAVSDGDSLRLDGRRICLVHIDSCEIDQYDRVPAECFTGDGASINLEAVRGGIAFGNDRRHAPRHVLEAEDAAKADRVGVWAAVVDHPRDHHQGAG